MTEEITERLKELEVKYNNMDKSIGEIKSDVSDLKRLTTAVEVIALKTTAVNDKVDKIDTRLDKIEAEPKEDFRQLKRTIINCACTTVIGALLGAVLALIIK